MNKAFAVILFLLALAQVVVQAVIDGVDQEYGLQIQFQSRLPHGISIDLISK